MPWVVVASMGCLLPWWVMVSSVGVAVFAMMGL